MKKLAVALALGGLFAGYAASAACTADDVALAQKFYDLAQGRFNAGQISETDVSIAQGALLEMKLCAGTLAKADYCAQMPAIVRGMVDLEETATSRGLGSYTQYAMTIERLARVKTFCSK